LIAGRIPAKSEEQSDKAAPLALAAKRSITSQEQGKSSAQLSSLLKNDKPNQLKAPPVLTEKREDRNEVGPAADKPGEGPVVASVPIEASTSELSAVQLKEDVSVGKQESADRAPLVSLEQNSTELQNIPPKVDLASLPLAPALAPIMDAPKVEGLLKEQPLSESKQAKTPTDGQAVALPSPKVLQGFVIQLAFGETGDARNWAETLERRGFVVSLTEAGGSGSVRVRIGNFTGREEAERQLQALRQNGLKGIVLNLPQAYRPEVHPAVVEESGKTISAVQ
jgi:cell division protein FtsN